MKTKTIAFACGMGLIAAGALSPDALAGHWYISGHAGAVFLQDAGVQFSSPCACSPSTLNADFDTGWGVGGAGGFGFDNGLRVEGEVTYRYNDLNKISASGTSFALPDTSVSSLAFMANGYYDIPTGSKWTPYVGGGVGLAIDHASADLSSSGGPNFSDTEAEFAYQGIAGIGYQITDAVNIGIEYRYFATMTPHYDLTSLGAPAGVFASADYASHNVFLTLRWNLN
jgi:OmpA-OmpF porin, OOP family